MKNGFDNAWKRLVVCDEEGNISFSTRTNEPETFPTFARAQKRAAELAEVTPGAKIYIYEATAYVRAPVGNTETARRHPREHYTAVVRR